MKYALGIIGLLGLTSCATAPYHVADELSAQEPFRKEVSLKNGSCAILETAYSLNPEELYSKGPSIFLAVCSSAKYDEWVAQRGEEWKIQRYRIGVGCSCDDEGEMHRVGMGVNLGHGNNKYDFERGLIDVARELK